MLSEQTIDDYIELAQISQFLAEGANGKQNALTGGANQGDAVLPYLLHDAWDIVKAMKPAYLGTAGYDNAANYMYSLCGRFILQARELLGNGSGVIVNPVTGVNSTIVAIYEQFTIGINSPIAAGATSYTLNYTNILKYSVSVEMPQDNVPEGVTDQFSDQIVYGQNSTVIKFTNDDGNGNNLGVQNGMLLIIRGLRYANTGTATSNAIALPTIVVNGDQIIDFEYDNAAYADHDLMLYYNGVKYLKKDVDYIVKPTGGFTIINGITYGDADDLIMSPNGLL